MGFRDGDGGFVAMHLAVQYLQMGSGLSEFAGANARC